MKNNILKDRNGFHLKDHNEIFLKIYENKNFILEKMYYGDYLRLSDIKSNLITINNLIKLLNYNFIFINKSYVSINDFIVIDEFGIIKLVFTDFNSLKYGSNNETQTQYINTLGEVINYDL